MNKLSDTQLKFGFKDLGPIQKEGEIKNSGLTLLYGFPNSGKSFVLRGLYGALAFSDEEMISELAIFSRKKMLLIIEETFEKNLKNLIVKLSNFSEIYSIIRYEFMKVSSKEFLENYFQEVVETVYSKVLPGFGTVTIGSEMTLSFEEIIEFPFGTDKFNNILRDSLEEFLSTVIGVETISNLSLNGELLSKLIENELKNLTYETINGEINIRQFPHKNMNRFRINDKSYPWALDYELFEISKQACKVKINGSLAFEKNFISQETLEIHNQSESNKSGNETLDTFLRKVNNMIKRESTNVHLPPIYEFRILPASFLNNFSNAVVKYFLDRIKSMFNTVSGIKEVRFIPFGRTPLIQLANEDDQYIQQNLRENTYSPSLSDPAFALYRVFKKWVKYSEEKLSSTNVLSFDSSVLLQGKLSYDERSKTLFYTDSKNKKIEIKYASAMANEVSGLILSYNSMNSNGLIIMEEPEAQLHPVSQINMALSLVALSSFGVRLVFSTHSDIFGQVIYFLYKYKPSARMIDELIDDISNEEASNAKNGKTSDLASQVHKAISSVEIDVYFIDKDSEIKPIPVESLGMDVPGITESAQLKLLNWTSRIAEGNNQN
ncbi:MAG: ATP-binding protein [Thermoplasmataceae archaeon]